MSSRWIWSTRTAAFCIAFSAGAPLLSTHVADFAAVSQLKICR